MARTVECDYLVVGAGAMGMAFLDEVLRHDPGATAVMVDRHARPGGHWNDDYAFVTLHQPAAFYGVNSRVLGRGDGEDLSTRQEILFYYEEVMKQLQATGRLQYLPLCEHRGDDRVVSLVASCVEYRVKPRRRLVDSTYMDVTIPATTPPKYEVDAEGGAEVVPPNALVNVGTPRPGYAVIGAGKTAMDTVLFLLAAGVPPSCIRWVVPHDAWFMSRMFLLPNSEDTIGTATIRVLSTATGLNDMFLRLEAIGEIMRLDPNVWPVKFRCAVLNTDELARLRSLPKENILRLGRVKRVEAERLVLDEGVVAVERGTLFVDCTADGLATRPPVPVFQDGRIVLQSIYFCQQVFSAALIGFMETAIKDDTKKNELCKPVSHPTYTWDYPVSMMHTWSNTTAWGNERVLAQWLRRSRLNMASHTTFATTLRQVWGIVRAYGFRFPPTLANFAQIVAEAREQRTQHRSSASKL